MQVLSAKFHGAEIGHKKELAAGRFSRYVLPVMIDLSIIVVYFVVLLVIGWRSRNQNAESYWVAGRRLGAPRITASMTATVLGASSTIGIIGLGYSRGLTAVWWLLIGSIFLTLLGFFFAGKIRRLGAFTLPEILEKEYGPAVSAPAGLMISIAWCGVIAAQIYAAGVLLNALFAIDLDTALIIGAGVLILYTLWGGQLSVIKTDLGQLILFILSLVIIFVFVVFADTSGSTLANIPETYFDFPTSDSFGAYSLFVYYPLIVGLPYLAGPDIYSRIFCAKDASSARKATFGSSLIIIPLAFMFAILGIFIKAQWPDLDPSTALPTAMNETIPVGLKGIIGAGFLGAIMSSADSCLISVGTIVSRNVVAPFAKIGESRQLKLTRIIVAIVGVIGLVIAIWQRGIISSLLLGYTVYVGGVVLPTLSLLIPRRFRISKSAAAICIALGGTTAIFGRVAGSFIKASILGETGEHMMSTLLGPEYLSILPLVISLMVIIFDLLIKKRAR